MEKVRYAGLNTPETHHPDKLAQYCGQEAFEANRRLVAGKTVRLESTNVAVTNTAASWPMCMWIACL